MRVSRLRILLTVLVASCVGLRAASTEPLPIQGLAHVTDASHTSTLLRERGLAPTSLETRGDGTRATTLRDPHGHLVAFAEYTPDSLEARDRQNNLGAREVSTRILVKKADAALKVKPLSVTEKSRVAPSGNANDYASTAPYFWPDPNKPDGLPYIRRDGQVNPESRTAASDLLRSQLMSRTVSTLADAYAATGEEKYAEHAALLLRTWFIDPATFMRPHLDFAQGVPGVNTGRQIGIIEGTSIVGALDKADRLSGSKSWTAADHEALMKWTSQFLDWYLHSPFGIQEREGNNNHGTYYDVQVMRMALMVGRTDLARQVAETAKEKRIAAQIAPDGSQPHELARATSFGYSVMNLRGFGTLASLSERVGVDLWNYESADGRSIRKAIDFLIPYVEDPTKKWPYQQIKEMDRGGLASLLREAGKVYREPRYTALASKQPEKADNTKED